MSISVSGSLRLAYGQMSNLFVEADGEILLESKSFSYKVDY